MKDLNPNAVACRRSGTYDAELVVNGVHYVISTGHQTRTDAMKVANEASTQLRKRLEEVASDFVAAPSRQWKKAKP